MEKPASLLRICGLSAVAALFERAPGRVLRLFYEARRARDVGRYCAHLAQTRRPYRQVSPDELGRIAGTVLHGGVVAIAEPCLPGRLGIAEARRLAANKTSLFVLDGIGNPHNVGAITRSLAFFGFRHLALSDHPQQAGLSDAAYRVAEGGLDRLTVYRAPQLPGLLQALRPIFHIVATALSQRGQPLEALLASPDPRPRLILLGNEEQGLPDATLAAAETVLTLPGAGGVQSLNVAATAAILAHGLRPPHPAVAPDGGQKSSGVKSFVQITRG
ncbi:RNA methyltransferase [Methyloparacoccus murrellii]